MITKENLDYSINNIKHKKTRSFLTILSIFVGITTIFVFISFGMGLYSYVQDFVGSSSADKVSVMPKGTGAPGLDDTFALTENDLQAVEKTAGVYEATALYAKVAEIKQDKLTKYVFLIGYNPDKPLIFDVSNIKLFKGRELKSGDKGKVVLGYNYLIPNKIFPKAYDVNDKIEIQGQEFRVVGFYESVGNPQDDSQIYTNTEDFEELYEEIKGYAWMIAQVDENSLDTVIDRIERAVRNSRNLEKGKEDFYVQSWQDMMETYSKVLNGIIGFVILIALVSVFISTINTANTMITSVLERTREIGVMKAIGARNSTVFYLFLLESAILGFIAGTLGVLVGWALSSWAGNFLASLGWSFISPHYSFGLFAMLIIFATLTGAISGAIPAYQASKINTVKALRYE